MEFKDGDTITVNGNPCRIEGGALVPVVQRGPLGGFVKRLGDCAENERIYLSARATQKGRSITCDEPIDPNLLVETNIPPRPTFTPMTAGEAAALPDIVGRWVAVQIDEKYTDSLPLRIKHSQALHLFTTTPILLIEGVDLP